MRLDLNLLRPLNALLHERSVTIAARRLGLSQPACSAALARLRRHFDDPLLIRVPGQGMQLTPLGLRLRDPVATLVEDIDTVLIASVAVDLSTLSREFTILASDCEAETVLPPLVRLLNDNAPLARLRVNAPTNAMRPHIDDQMRVHDLVVLPTQALPADVPSTVLYSDNWSLIVGIDSDLPANPSLADVIDRRWAVCYDLPSTPWSPARLLEVAGIRSAACVRTEGFQELFSVVDSTDLIALVPQRLAERRCIRGRTRWLPAPREIAGSFTISLAWSSVHSMDPAHQWLREHAIRETLMHSRGLPPM